MNTDTATLSPQRPCSILTDGHRAIATHTVASSAFGFTVGHPAKRLFCEACAEEEVEFLTSEGFDAAKADRPYRESVVRTADEAAADIKADIAAGRARRAEASARNRRYMEAGE